LLCAVLHRLLQYLLACHDFAQCRALLGLIQIGVGKDWLKSEFRFAIVCRFDRHVKTVREKELWVQGIWLFKKA
jgi:hypothetical protein